MNSKTTTLLFFLVIFCSGWMVPFSVSQWTHLIGGRKSKDFVHYGLEDKKQDAVSTSQVAQFLMDAAGLSSSALDGPAFPLQADLFQSPKLNVLLLMNTDQKIIDENAAAAFSALDIHMSMPLNEGAEDGDVKDLPHVVLSSVVHTHGGKALIIANEACHLNSPFVNSIVAEEVDSSASTNRKAPLNLDHDVVASFQSIVNHFISNKINPTWQDKVKDKVSDMIILCSSGSEDHHPQESFLKRLETFIQDMEKFYPESVLVHVVSTSNMKMPENKEARRLQEVKDLFSESNNSTITIQPLTIQDIESYQVVLWTSIMLSITLLITICCLCNMPIKRDSLLYAKFQMGVDHRKVN